MNNAMKGLLLSGLVFPGLGQFLLGRKVSGIVFISMVTTALACYGYGLIVRMWRTLVRLHEIAVNPQLMPESLLTVYARVFAPASSMDMLALAGLIGAWLAAILHAYLVGRQLDRR